MDHSVYDTSYVFSTFRAQRPYYYYIIWRAGEIAGGYLRVPTNIIHTFRRFTVTKRADDKTVTNSKGGSYKCQTVPDGILTLQCPS